MATKKNSPAAAGSNPTNSNHATAAEGGSIMVEPRNTGTAAELVDTTPALAECELIVMIWRDEYAEFKGSAAQLRAEGVIPDGFEWPRAAADKRWEANGFKYWLRRTKPEGWKGLMKSWFEVDNWFIRLEVSGRSQAERNHMGLVRKAAELRAEFHRCTPAGRREWAADCNRYWATHNDKGFQAFKALIPGLIPAKRGRKAKTT